MNRLSEHIEYLLLNHNCVIVPQFGAFIASISTSQRVESEELFFPPRRIVRFNPDLTEDDGLLVEVVKAVHRITIQEAKRQVQGMVLQLRQQLLSEGQVDFGSIGIFSQDEDGHVNFSTCKAGIPTPQFYGLDVFTIPKLTTIERRDILASAHKKRSIGFSDTDKIVISINRRSLRYAVASVAAILICVLFSTPIALNRQHTIQEASVVSTEVASKKVNEKPTTLVYKVSEQNGTLQNQEETKHTASAHELVQSSATTTNSKYAIVLASDVSLKNAENYVSDLRSRGYDNAAIHDNGKIRRVILTGYTNETEAYNANSLLHKTSKEFAASWVLNL